MRKANLKNLNTKEKRYLHPNLERQEMSETTIITCPKCKAEIPLTESLAAPIIEEARKEFEERLAEKEGEFTQKEKELRNREKSLTAAQRNFEEEIDHRVSETLENELERIKQEESAKAQRKAEALLSEKDGELAELQGQLNSRNEKLAEAQKAQAELIILKRDLEDKEREIDLTIQTKIQEGLAEVRDRAASEAEMQASLKLAGKDETIRSMGSTIKELQRKAEQGSQQLQGEAQEIVLKNLLESKFPTDNIGSVSKGEFGGDVLHGVYGQGGQICGLILWESKRTKTWNNSWLEKLRRDRRAAKADIAVIVSETMPKGVDTFALIDGVWVVSLRFVLPLAMVLRMGLFEVSQARQTAEGQQTKTEMVYQYLTGTGFRNRVTAIVEAFIAMQDDLRKERRAIQRQWAKREMQLDKALEAASGMYGDLQAIAGQSLQEIEGLEFHELEAGEDDDEPNSDY